MGDGFPTYKFILIRVVQKKAWNFLSKIFMESQRLKVGKLNGNFKESYRKQVRQHPCLKLLEEKQYWEGMIFHVPIFIGSQWPNHIFHIH